MAEHYRDVIVCASHMGLAIIRGLLNSQLEREILIVERGPERRARLRFQFALASTPTLPSRPQSAGDI
jgi:pyrroline-5-carboxylate reductase